MELVNHTTRLVNQAYWLIKIRWLATTALCLLTSLGHIVFKLDIRELALYIIAIALICENMIALLWLYWLNRSGTIDNRAVIKRVIFFQIIVDLFIVTSLIHFSGGIQSPFVFFYMFHVVLWSIMLAMTNISYLVASIAVILLGSIALLEYKEILPHNNLPILKHLTQTLYQDSFYVIGMLSVFAVTLYFLVFMTSMVSKRLRRQEEAYKEANEKLHQKDTIKNEYVLRITHDIKGHLAAINSCLSVVTSNIYGELDEKQKEFVERAYARSIQLINFVRDLLRLTRVRLEEKFEKSEFSLRQTIIDTIENNIKYARDNLIELNASIDPNVENITGNQFSIQEVLYNLLMNSIQYTHPGGDINICAKDQNSHILIEVIDTGVGIPEEEQELIFNEFYRGSNVKKFSKSGTGMGLSIIKQIIIRHGGNIWVSSKIGEGSTFSFTLPKE